MNNRTAKSKILKTIITAGIFLITAVMSFLVSVNCFFGISEKDIYSFFGIREFSSKADGYPFSVHFIDVGCGDCILIRCGNKNALIDTGNFSFDERAKSYLKHCGLKKLDLFIATHTDSDHIGDFPSIADSFDIDELWISDFCIPNDSEMTDIEKIFFDKINEKNIKTVSPNINKNYYFGSAKLKVLSPLKRFETQNDNSLVIKLVYGNVSFLFTGDAGEETEKILISENTDLNSTVLKLAHHGSKTASTEEFLKAVSPEYGVISAGDENKYLPNRNIIERIEKVCNSILRTDVDGSIIFACDGDNINIFKEKE